MKKFIEELKRTTRYLEETSETEPEVMRKHSEMMEKYEPLIGCRALYKSGRQESRVVTIEEVHSSYLIVSYKYYGRDYMGQLRTCSMYNSLICGDDRLDLG